MSPNQAPLRVLRLAAVKAKTGLPTSTLYTKIAKGEFPRSVPLGAAAVGWIESEIDGWIEACRCKRDGT